MITYTLLQAPRMKTIVRCTLLMVAWKWTDKVSRFSSRALGSLSAITYANWMTIPLSDVSTKYGMIQQSE